MTPVCIALFNRPDKVDALLRALRSVKPDKLYFFADGPRADRPADVEACRKAREATQLVDWPCQVERRFLDHNVGCGPGPCAAWSWVLEREESAILLEDDCIPGPDFFPFCEAMLARYADDARVMLVGGARFASEAEVPFLASYHFTRFTQTWGWATWRRAWRHFDFSLPAWPLQRDWFLRSGIARNTREFKAWEHFFAGAYAGKARDFWDYQWQATVFLQGGLCIVPCVNLVTNIGSGADATHFVQDDVGLLRRPTGRLPTPYQHPPCVCADKLLDEWILDHVHFQKRPLHKRVLGRLARDWKALRG